MKSGQVILAKSISFKLKVSVQKIMVLDLGK
jgi:hypothetical protein